MLIRNPIGCFTHIECGKLLFNGAFPSHDPVWVLVGESNESVAQIASGITLDNRGFEILYQLCLDGLLHELHAGWLGSDDTWGFERFRYGYDLNRSLRIEFQEGDTIDLGVVPEVREGVFHKREYVLQSQRPFPLYVLFVTDKSVSGGPWTVLRDDVSVVDIFLHNGKNITPEK